MAEAQQQQQPTRKAITFQTGRITANQSDRVAAHTHITGLGLLEDGSASDADSTMIGQDAAREAAGWFVELCKTQKIAGRGVLIAGGPGTGKTALAIAMAKELGAGTPVCAVSASQVYSKEVKKTEVLAEQCRKAIGLRIRETKEVYEGEVTEMTVTETEDPVHTYGRTISHVVLGLKTTKGTKTLKLDPTMYDALAKEQVQVGDVIYIEANSGAVKRLGRSDTFATEFDLEAEEYVPLPKGDVHKKRAVVQDVTLHDLDVANAQPSAGGNQRDVMSLLSSLGKPRKTEITDKLRQEINKVVNRYIDQGVAELIPGVLFIDEVHMLDLECFTFLNRTLESPFSPIIVLATNRGITKIQGTDIVAPHGIPVDCLDRLLIIPTHPYKKDEMQKIIALRAKTEKLNVSDLALDLLGSVAERSSLRYAVQLLTPASILAECSGRTTIEIADIQGVDTLFLDGKASAHKLQENSEGYL